MFANHKAQHAIAEHINHSFGFFELVFLKNKKQNHSDIGLFYLQIKI